MEEFLTPDFLKFFVPLAGAVVAWFLNERRRRAQEEYLRKEEKYGELIRALKGFYVETSDAEVRRHFIEQLNLCWLYCPDEVILRAYDMLRTVQVGSPATQEERWAAFGAFFLAIRKDLISHKLVRATILKPTDFLHMSPGK